MSRTSPAQGGGQQPQTARNIILLYSLALLSKLPKAFQGISKEKFRLAFYS